MISDTGGRPRPSGVFHHTSGSLAAQPVIASSSAANEISSGSLSAGPMSCTPIGNPSEVKPAGTLIDGQPNRFHAHVRGHAAIALRSVASHPSRSHSCTGGGGWAVVGAMMTSTRLKIHDMRRCTAASWARALRSTFCDSSRPMRMLATVRWS